MKDPASRRSGVGVPARTGAIEAYPRAPPNQGADFGSRVLKRGSVSVRPRFVSAARPEPSLSRRRTPPYGGRVQRIIDPNRDVGSLLLFAAHRHPDAVAVEHGEARWTYAEFALRAARLVSSLQAQGLSTGDVVAWLGDNTPGAALAYFARRDGGLRPRAAPRAHARGGPAPRPRALGSEGGPRGAATRRRAPRRSGSRWCASTRRRAASRRGPRSRSGSPVKRATPRTSTTRAAARGAPKGVDPHPRQRRRARATRGAGLEPLRPPTSGSTRHRCSTWPTRGRRSRSRSWAASTDSRRGSTWARSSTRSPAGSPSRTSCPRCGTRSCATNAPRGRRTPRSGCSSRAGPRSPRPRASRARRRSAPSTRRRTGSRRRARTSRSRDSTDDERALPAAEQDVLLSRAGRPMPGVDVLVLVAGAGSAVPADGTSVGEVVARGPTVTPGLPPRTRRPTARGDSRRVVRGPATSRASTPTGASTSSTARGTSSTRAGRRSSRRTSSARSPTCPACAELAVVGTPDPHWGEVVTAVVVEGAGRVTLEALADARPRAARRVPGPAPARAARRAPAHRLRQDQQTRGARRGGPRSLSASGRQRGTGRTSAPRSFFRRGGPREGPRRRRRRPRARALRGAEAEPERRAALVRAGQRRDRGGGRVPPRPRRRATLEGIVVFAKKAGVDLVVVGPEAPLVAGLGRRAAQGGDRRASGPTRRARARGQQGVREVADGAQQHPDGRAPRVHDATRTRAPTSRRSRPTPSSSRPTASPAARASPSATRASRPRRRSPRRWSSGSSATPARRS